MLDLTNAGKSVGRLTNRAKREVLFRAPPVRLIAEGRERQRQHRYAASLPPLSVPDWQVIGSLSGDGVHVTTLERLALPGTPQVKEQLDQLVEALAPRPVVASTLRPSRDELLDQPAVWRFGLSDRVLDIVENYLGVPARYYGADVRREVADGRPPHDVRQWHRDVEDYRVLKMLLWLNDVDVDGGPFAYIPRTVSARAVDRLRYVGGFVSDEKMRRTVPESQWRVVTGPKWTAVVPDTAQLLHRATPPRTHDRYSVTFTWTTRHPVRINHSEAFTPDQVRRIRSGLSGRQLACLPNDLG